DGEVVEQVALDPSGAGWVQHQAGWSPCRMVVVGHEYEALKPTPAWVGIDKPPKEKKVRKTIQRLVHATMAPITDEISCIKSESGNKAIEVGVIPADKAEEALRLQKGSSVLNYEGNFLFEGCDCGVKSTGTKGGSDKTVFDIYMKSKPQLYADRGYIEVIADLDARTAKVMVGDSREQMVEVKSMDIPFEDDVKLVARMLPGVSFPEAITGWNNTKVRLEAPMRDKLGDSLRLKECKLFGDESDGEEEDSDGPVVTSCGNAAGLQLRQPYLGKFQVYLDGELHLSVRDPGGLVADGRFSIDPREVVPKCKAVHRRFFVRRALSALIVGMRFPKIVLRTLRSSC
ncbi:unnamed protein product, partial [Symbiodinium microadriaticum]